MHKLSQIPFFDELKDAQNILIAGAGGGFDIYSGIPLYFSLLERGKTLWLANLSFTILGKTNAKVICPNCYEVTHRSRTTDEWNYFPERFLSMWMLTQQLDIPVYAFNKTGVKPLREAYEHLVKLHHIDTIILVDGGTDSLMFGDEEKLGTPVEDGCSIVAVDQVRGVERKFLSCLGFGIDHFHGVSHYRFLENLNTLWKEGGYLGLMHLMPDMREAKLFRELVDFANKLETERPSIVANSIYSTLDGKYGDYHRTERTKAGRLWINPLMSIYWNFRLDNVAAQLRYYNAIKNTTSLLQLTQKLFDWRENLSDYRANRKIPL